jgi:nucleotide-binding universal stress UspA family protein
MFNNVLAAVDGQPGGRDAVALAGQLAARGGKLTLGHVYAWHHNPSIRGYDHGENAEMTRARELLDATRDEAKLEADLRWIGAESPGRGLHELAEATGADLLVIGSTRWGLIGRVLVGDDTCAALAGAPCAVAVAPAGYRDHPASIRRIGVAYDGSPDSERALAVARTLASDHGAALAAMEVVWFPAYLFGQPVAEDTTRIDDLLDAARNRVGALRDVQPEASYGQPAEELASWSASLDLLVVGSRGIGPVGRLMHGSTSTELTRRARCPLLVVTRAPRRVTEPEEELATFHVAVA